MDGVVAAHCNRGISSVINSTVTVSNALITGNTIAGEINTNAIGRTYGNNRIFGNGNNTLAGFTPIAEQ